MDEKELALFIEHYTKGNDKFYNRTDIVQRGEQIFAVDSTDYSAGGTNKGREPIVSETQLTPEETVAWLREKSIMSPYHSTFQVQQECFEFFADNPAFAEVAKCFNATLAEFKWKSQDGLINHEHLTWDKGSQSYEMTECQGNGRRIYTDTLESVKITEDDAVEWLMQRVRDKSGEFEMKDAVCATHFPDITDELIQARNDRQQTEAKAKKTAAIER